MNEPRVEFFENGPIFVKGPMKFINSQGEEIMKERPNIALCRCGQSSDKPFCDGTHKEVGFQAQPGGLYDV